MFLLILLIILNAIRIPNQFHKNKDDLIILFYYKNLEIQSKIKVKIDILKRNLKLCIHFQLLLLIESIHNFSLSFL